VTEQLTFPLSGDRRSLAVRYAEWRASADGQDVVHQVERIALDQLTAGEGRISINRIWELVRSARHVQLNNDYRAGCARELIACHPELRGKIETRKLKAA
jgi:hypothetical protein